jgi:hypothetical protein
MKKNFDEKIISKIRWSKNLESRIPSRYVILEGDKFITLGDIIVDNLEIGLTLLQIYQDILKKKYQTIDIASFAYIYDDHIKDLKLPVDPIEVFYKDLKFNYEQFNDEFQEWNLFNQKYIDKEDKILANVDKITDKLLTVTPMENGKIKYDKILSSFTVTYDGAKLDIEQGLDFFDNIILSKNIPFVQWNNNSSVPHFKFMDKESIPAIIDKTKNCFIIQILNSDKTYTTAILNLETSSMEVVLTIQNDNKKVREIESAFYFLEFHSEKISNIQCSFTVNNVYLDESSFLIALYGYQKLQFLNFFLYIDETRIAQCDKKRMNLFFKTYTEDLSRTSHSISFSFMDILSTSFTVRVKKAESQADLEHFIFVFNYLIAFYNEHRTKIIEELKFFIKDYEPNEKKEDFEEVKKLTSLHAKSKDVFSKSYSMICQCPQQPIIITPEEEKDWGELIYKENKRQIVSFPPANPNRAGVKPLFKFVCPDDEISFPDLKPNKLGDSEFPFVPCCARTDSSSKKSAKLYWEVKNGDISFSDATASKNQKGAHRLSSMKFLNVKQDGVLPKDFNNLLNSKTDDRRIYLRYWVQESPSSLIHAVLNAMEPDKYYAMSSNDREKRALEIRSQLAGKNLGIYKQEMYDQSETDIKNIIENYKLFLDPQLFFRGVEEFFNINIVVFTYDNENVVPEIPRFKLVHLRKIKPERKTVLILKHWGNNSEGILKYPHCEIIIDSGPHKKETVEILREGDRFEKQREGKRFIFEEDITKLMIELIDNIIHYKTWSLPINDQHKKSSELFEERIMPYSKIEWLSIFNKELIKSQFIDNYGKCIGLNLYIEGEFFTIFFPPTIPFDCKITQTPNVTTKKTVLKFFNQPFEERSDGLWFSLLDYRWGFFIPCSDTRNLGDFSPEPPIKLTSSNPLEIIRRVSKNAKILTKMIIRCWQLSHVENIDVWWKSNVILDETILEIAHEPNHLERKLPTFNLIKTFEGWWPAYFKKGKICLSPDLWKKLFSFIKKFVKDTQGLPIEENIYLDELYEDESNFKTIPNTMILIGEERIKAWQNYQDMTLSITNVMAIENQQRKEPFLYHNLKNKRDYIIQNFQTFEKAISCALIWKETSCNSSYDTLPIEAEILSTLSYLIYKVDGNNLSIVKIVNEGTEGPDGSGYLEILCFSDKKYASMLPL